jgi:hypothetical protein
LRWSPAGAPRAEKAERRGIRTPEGVAKAVLHFARAEL